MSRILNNNCLDFMRSKTVGDVHISRLLEWPSDHFDMLLNAHVMIKDWNMSTVL